MSQTRDLVETLIGQAARDEAGEEIPWPLVEASAIELSNLPGSSTALRRKLAGLNNPEIARTLQDWFLRVAAARDRDARKAARPSEKLLAPLQAVAFGAAGTAAILAVAGTLPLLSGFVSGLAALSLAFSTSYGRWRLSEREDEARSDATALRRMAEIAGR